VACALASVLVGACTSAEPTASERPESSVVGVSELDEVTSVTFPPDSDTTGITSAVTQEPLGPPLISALDLGVILLGNPTLRLWW